MEKLPLFNNDNLPLYGSVGMASLHLLLCMKMSMQFRVKFVKIAENYNANDTENIPMKESNKFKINERTQLNIAEYSGVLIALLLYIQTQINRKNIKLTKQAKISIYLTVIGSYLFAIGFLNVKTPSQTNIIKFIGAISRYTGFGGLIYYLFKLAKSQE